MFPCRASGIPSQAARLFMGMMIRGFRTSVPLWERNSGITQSAGLGFSRETIIKASPQRLETAYQLPLPLGRRIKSGSEGGMMEHNQSAQYITK